MNNQNRHSCKDEVRSENPVAYSAAIPGSSSVSASLRHDKDDGKGKPYIFFKISFFFLFLFICFFLFPSAKKDIPYSSVFYDRNGQLLRMTLASDGQYRLPVSLAEIPADLKRALLLYEDKYFYLHGGVNPVSMFRAVRSVLVPGRRLGASTLSMQTARLLFNLKTRSLTGKLKQILGAKYLELFYSKDHILTLYFTLAPYGHNVSGIQAASLVYFHRPVSELTLPEMLSLVVIPQNPAQRRPTTAEGVRRLTKAKEILAPHFDDSALLPVSFYAPADLPFLFPHATTDLLQKSTGIFHLTVDSFLQKQMEGLVRSYLDSVRHKGVYNASVLLVDWRTQEVVSYIGSADYFDDTIEGQVNGITSLRSPGSALKPFIYALGLEQGLIHPFTMLKDLPRHYGVYTPENYDRSFMGILTAKEALMQSRNVPAVDLQLALSGDSFYDFILAGAKVSLKPASYYGLALALGGFEISPFQVARLYTGLANLGLFQDLTLRRPTYYYQPDETEPDRLLSKEAAYLTLFMLRQRISGVSVPVFYKTGTSFGYKDAWTAGIFGPYVLVVWLGNFDGTANASFLGRQLAVPLFLQIARFLSDVQKPLPDLLSDETGLSLATVDICRPTGDLAGPFCPSRYPGKFIPLKSPVKVSTVHRQIPVVKATGLRACYADPPRTEMKVYEFWPSDILKVFERAGFKLVQPPPFEKDCSTEPAQSLAPDILSPMRLDYYVREDEKIPFKASADGAVTALFWFLDDRFIGTSQPSEMLFFAVPPGTYDVTVTDDMGRSAVSKLTVRVREN